MAIRPRNEDTTVLVAQPSGNHLEIAACLNGIGAEKMPHGMVAKTRQPQALARTKDLHSCCSNLEYSPLGLRFTRPNRLQKALEWLEKGYGAHLVILRSLFPSRDEKRSQSKIHVVPQHFGGFLLPAARIGQKFYKISGLPCRTMSLPKVLHQRTKLFLARDDDSRLLHLPPLEGVSGIVDEDFQVFFRVGEDLLEGLHLNIPTTGRNLHPSSRFPGVKMLLPDRPQGMVPQVWSNPFSATSRRLKELGFSSAFRDASH